MNKSYLARLGSFSHVEIKALALAGLVLLDGVNSGRILPSGLDTNALIDAGYGLQDAIHSGASDLPVVMLAFDTAAIDSGIGERHE